MNVRASVFALSALAVGCAGGTVLPSNPGSGRGGSNPGGEVAPTVIAEVPALVGAAAGADRLHVRWEVPSTGTEIAIFLGESASNLLASAPRLQATASGSAVLTGLDPETTYRLGLGYRSAGASSYRSAGAPIRLQTMEPIFVNVASTAAQPDGSDPSSAYADLTSGILAALSQGGGNVWVAEGDYGVGSVPLFSGVNLFGGFPSSFDLGGRDAEQRPTRVRALSNQPVLSLGVGTEGSVVDGLRIDGANQATVGIDVDGVPFELRDVHVTRCSGRGIRIRGGESGDPISGLLVGCSSTANAADGMSVLGAHDLAIVASRFDDNVQEGLDLDDLVAPDGRTVTLSIVNSRFAGNGTQGLDVDLAAPSSLGPTGGLFEVRVAGSRFIRNGEEGLLVDFDFEFAPGWRAAVSVVDSVARGNAGAGFHLDCDAPGSAHLQGISATSNGAEGVWISSESNPGVVVLGASALVGNGGPGVRSSFGNRTLLVSHCLFSGNAGGGVVSEVTRSTVTSSVAYLQSDPLVGAVARGSVLREVSDSDLFVNAARAVGVAVDVGLDEVLLGAALDAAPSDVLELADDGVDRIVRSVQGNLIRFDPALLDAALPCSVAVFDPTDSVAEDYRLPPGSVAAGAGLAPAGLLADAGPWGAPRAFSPGEVGFDSPDTFVVAEVTPALVQSLGSSEPIVIEFAGGTPSMSLAAGAVRAVTSGGTNLDIDYFVENGGLHVLPPPSGWGQEEVFIELHSVIRTIDDRPLSAPVTLPFEVSMP